MGTPCRVVVRSPPHLTTNPVICRRKGPFVYESAATERDRRSDAVHALGRAAETAGETNGRLSRDGDDWGTTLAVALLVAAVVVLALALGCW